MKWVWLSRPSIETFHRSHLKRHGGLAGIRDENALEAALGRPLNKAANGEPDLCDLGAAYLYGIARNHPFNDGNKRTAIVAAGVFLMANGREIAADNAMLYQFVLDVAAGLVGKDNAARWLRDFSIPRR